MTKLLSYVIKNIIGIATLILVAIVAFGGGQSLGGTTNYDQLDTTDGYSVDGTSIINGSGSFVGAINGTQFQLDSGTTLGEFTCTTATWDPSSISSSTVASTSVAITGVAVGDIMLASFNSATSTDDWYMTANVRNTGSSTAYIVPAIGSAAYINGLNLSTSTLRVCQLGF